MLHWCRSRLRFIALILLSTLAFQGPAAGVMAAWSAAHGRQIPVILCTSSGMISVMIDAVGEDADRTFDQTQRMQQCHFCKAGIPLPVVLAAVLLLLPSDDGQAVFPAADTVGASPGTRPWLRAPVRAPPLS